MLVTENLEIESHQLKKAALYFRAIDHKLRQDILKLIHQEGRMTVTMLCEKLQLQQAVASQHLTALRRTKLVFAERQGKNVFYTINTQQVENLHRLATQLLQ